jgi:glycosyltransferase involved in cell wall biosynthesis
LADVPGVEVVGQVQDVRPYLTEAAVGVVPLRIARGVQNKVLEALAMSKPVVASPQALTGFADKADFPALTASSANEWIDTVLRLLGDEPMRRTLGVAGRRYVEEHFSWDSCLRPLDALLGLTGVGDDVAPCLQVAAGTQDP